MLQIETGKPDVSIRNVLKLAALHGPPVGVVHRITPSRDQSTIVVFWDTMVYEATGLGCGALDVAGFALKSVISMMPGGHVNIEGDIVGTIGNAEDQNLLKSIAKNSTLLYCFGPSRQYTKMLTEDCRGYHHYLMILKKMDTPESDRVFVNLEGL